MKKLCNRGWMLGGGGGGDFSRYVEIERINSIDFENIFF